MPQLVFLASLLCLTWLLAAAGNFPLKNETARGGDAKQITSGEARDDSPAWSLDKNAVRDSHSADLDDIALNAEAQGFNGSVYIARNGTPILDKAYGWTAPDRRRRVDTSTLFNIASVSKAITATAILGLVETGNLSVHQRIEEILSGVPSDKESITIEELLLHTSCLPDLYAANGLSSRDAAVKAILATRLLCKPGTEFHYTDDGYTLLAAIIEVVSGKQYAHFVRENVFRPAGMKASKFWEEVDDRTSSDVARIVTLELSNRQRGVNWGYIGPGGIWSNADELARYFLALMAGKIVTMESVSEMLMPREKVSIGSAGYGWFIGRSTMDTPLILARGNEDWGHSALIFWYPDRKILLTIATNSGFDHGTPLSRVLAARLEGVLLSSCNRQCNGPTAVLRMTATSRRLLSHE